MYEYKVYNVKTNEEKILFGYTFEKACAKAKINPADYEIEYAEYVD